MNDLVSTIIPEPWRSELIECAKHTRSQPVTDTLGRGWNLDDLIERIRKACPQLFRRDA